MLLSSFVTLLVKSNYLPCVPLFNLKNCFNLSKVLISLSLELIAAFITPLHYTEKRERTPRSLLKHRLQIIHALTRQDKHFFSPTTSSVPGL